MVDRSYRCSNCLEHTISRGFDVSHLSVTCENCGAFARFVNSDVFEQFRAFEDSPPESLDWDRLDRVEKFLVCDGVVREGKTIEDFAVRED